MPLDDPNTIRISYDDARSTHVDDLLQRQAAMRGERGITARRGRSWYYQNWFVFMIAGGLAAFAAWAIIEPFFDDMSYIQGPITAMAPHDTTPPRIYAQGQTLTLTLPVTGWIEVRGIKVYLFSQSKELAANGSKRLLDPGTLQPGQYVGAYLHTLEVPGQPVALAGFIEPAPSKSSRASVVSLQQLRTQHLISGLSIFPLVAGLIGLLIGGIDGAICRLTRRALLAGAVGLLAGLLGGFVSGIVANMAYAPITKMASEHQGDAVSSFSTWGFILQMGGRTLAWGLAGLAMGLGQGLALRSKRLLIYGLLGGIVGGLLGGLLFDPIDMLILGVDKPSAHISRMVGITVIGAAVGFMIGIVERLARDAWLRMLEGPLAGKEFLLFKDTMSLGASPRSDIYLFSDTSVAQNHAMLRAIGDECEIECRSPEHVIYINQRPTNRARLRHGDQISIGRAVFVFERRQG